MLHFVFFPRIPNPLNVIGGIVVFRWLIKRPKPVPAAAVTFDERELLQLHEEPLQWSLFRRKAAVAERPKVRATFTKRSYGKIEITGSKPLTEQEARAVLTLMRAHKGFAWPKAGETLDIDMTTALPITTLR